MIINMNMSMSMSNGLDSASKYLNYCASLIIVPWCLVTVKFM